jgi:hypothetical protein
MSGKIILQARNSAFKITPLILNRWSARSMIGGLVVILSLITLVTSSQSTINSITQVVDSGGNILK